MKGVMNEKESDRGFNFIFDFVSVPRFAAARKSYNFLWTKQESSGLDEQEDQSL